MILNKCPDCQEYFYEDEYFSLTLYQVKTLTECKRLEDKICPKCEERIMLVARMNLIAESCSACGEYRI